MKIKTTKSEAPKKRVRKNVILGRQYFLTLSQSTLSTKVAYEALLALEKQLEHLAVVCETHTADVAKGKHLHVYLSYTKQRELSLRHFDYLQRGVHVERVKSKECLLAYMNKENECKSNFDVWRVLLSHSRAMASRTLARMALLGFSLNEVQVKYYDLLAPLPWETMKRFAVTTASNAEELKRAKGIDDVLRWIDRALIEARLTPAELEIFDSDPQFQVLVDYINRVKKYGSEQLHKECTLSLVSAPSTGKTSLLLKLAKHYNNYDFPSDGWHRDTYVNHFHSMWTWNEWSFNTLSMEDMLTLTEGLKTDLRVKCAKTFKADRPMLFLMDNESWKRKYERRFSYLKRTMLESYKIRLTAFEVRIRELDFGEKNLFFLQKLLVGVNEDL